MQHSTELTIQYSYYRQHVADVCVVSETLCQSLHYDQRLCLLALAIDCHLLTKLPFRSISATEMNVSQDVSLSFAIYPSNCL